MIFGGGGTRTHNILNRATINKRIAIPIAIGL